MIKLNKTKHALLTSIVVLLLCVSMLVGSTFAWFSDKVTSASNIIKSGTLDVAFEWADGTEDVPDKDSADWHDASNGQIFKSDLWEPGFTEVYHIKIENEGSLALKYELKFFVDGRVSKLADVIDVYYTDPAAKVENGAQLIEANKIGTLTEVLEKQNNTVGINEDGLKSTIASDTLDSGDYDTITIALKMRESAGNEYQDLEIGHVFHLQLFATQNTVEEDSFDDQYDKDADFPVIIVSTAKELLDALKNADECVDIKLANDITIEADDSGISLDKNSNLVYNLDLNNKTLTCLRGKATIGIYSGTLNIKNGTIKNINTKDGVDGTDGHFIYLGYHITAQHNLNYSNDPPATLNMENVIIDSSVATQTVDIDKDGHSPAPNGQLIQVRCNSELNLYNCSFKVMMADGRYTAHIDVTNDAYNAVVNLYEGTTFYGDPRYQPFKDCPNLDWFYYVDEETGNERTQHVFIAEGYKLEEAPIKDGDKYAWYTVVPE